MKTIFSAIAALALIAVPGCSSVITSFGFATSTNGTVTLDASGNVTAITGVSFGSFTDGLNANNWGTALSFDNTLHQLKVTATGPFGTDASSRSFTNITTNTVLLTITYTALTSLKDGSASSQPLNVAFPNSSISSVSVDANLLSDLGWTGPVTTTFGGAITGPNATYGSTNTANSNTLSVNLTAASTPEPSSIILIGTGLLGLGLARKRARR